MKIYFDVCCLNRPFDDQSQPRIRLESEAILFLLQQCREQKYQWISSQVVLFEINRTPAQERKTRVQQLIQFAETQQQLNDVIISRGEFLQTLGFRGYDALHLACAEASGAKVLFTTDDKFLRRAQKNHEVIEVAVVNPLDWMQNDEAL